MTLSNAVALASHGGGSLTGTGDALLEGERSAWLSCAAAAALPSPGLRQNCEGKCCSAAQAAEPGGASA